MANYLTGLKLLSGMLFPNVRIKHHGPEAHESGSPQTSHAGSFTLVEDKFNKYQLQSMRWISVLVKPDKLKGMTITGELPEGRKSWNRDDGNMTAGVARLKSKIIHINPAQDAGSIRQTVLHEVGHLTVGRDEVIKKVLVRAWKEIKAMQEADEYARYDYGIVSENGLADVEEFTVDIFAHIAEGGYDALDLYKEKFGIDLESVFSDYLTFE